MHYDARPAVLCAINTNGTCSKVTLPPTTLLVLTMACSAFQLHPLPPQVGAEELLREARARHAAFLDLERSMLEVHQLYLDMATLVDAQGQTLDEIEAQVGRERRELSNDSCSRTRCFL